MNISLNTGRRRSSRTARSRRRVGLVGLVLAGLIAQTGTASAAPVVRDLAAACPETRVPVAGFADTAGTTFQEQIDCLLWWGVASGRSATTYGPNLTTNRAQMATFLANLIREAGGELPTNAPSAFRDSRGSTHEANINALAAVGVVAGTTATTYSPSRTVTRAQMATFVFRTYRHLTGEELSADQDYFNDDNGSVHEAAINAIAQAGITGGDGSGAYLPGRAVTRGQMAAFLTRLLDLLVDTGFASPPPMPDAMLGYDLARVARSGSGFIGQTCSGYTRKLSVINGQTFERALECRLERTNSGRLGWEEYDLGRDYERFTATIGQEDRSVVTTAATRFTVYGDGRVLATHDLAFGQSRAIDVDVTNVLRLRLEVARLSDSDSGQVRVAWGAATVGG